MPAGNTQELPILRHQRSLAMNVPGCVAVITGGASGLGEACARSLVKHGAKVAILDLAEDRGKTIASELDGSAIFFKTNIVDEQQVQGAIAKTVESFGAVHAAINCAGIGPAAKVLSKKGVMPLDQFMRVVDINLIGTFNVIRYAAEKMAQNTPNEDGERGVIVNTASIAASEGQIGQTAYSASKAAVTGLTLPAAREFAEHGIRVVTIVPGLFDTPLAGGLPDKVRDALIAMIPFPHRFGRPEEFAKLVEHIIENAFINGTSIRLDGALRMAGK
jgi:NAD(P)-dependent dehydrogenase (short-subunit alcohol dehydrogenase family)